MPATRTSKQASRKDKGKGRASPCPSRSRSRSRSPSTHFPQLFEYSRLLKPNWLDRVLLVLFVLYSLNRKRKMGSIAIRTKLLTEVDKRSRKDNDNPLAGRERSWLTNIHGALATLRRHKLLEWHDHRQDCENVELTSELKDLFDKLLKDVKGDTRFGRLSSLSLSQHRAISMWFRGYCKENQIKNLTKHEGYMDQMDIEREKHDLQAEYREVERTHSSQEEPGQQAQFGSQQTSGTPQPQYRSDGNADMLGTAPAMSSTTLQNAVAGPSRLPHTPRRPSIHTPAAAYPTPESPPRKTRSEELHGGASTAQLPIRALTLSVCPSGDSDDDIFHDTHDEMDVDELRSAPPTHREVQLQSQVTDLMREKTELVSLNANLLAEIEVYKFQILKLSEQIKAEKDAKKEVQKELERKQDVLADFRKAEAHLRVQVENYKADKLANFNVLKRAHARCNSLFQRLRRECTQMRKEIDDLEKVVEDHEAAQKRNQEAMAAFQANFVVVSPR